MKVGDLVADKDCFHTNRIGIFFDNCENKFLKVFWFNDGVPYFSTVSVDTVKTVFKIEN